MTIFKVSIAFLITVGVVCWPAVGQPQSKAEPKMVNLFQKALAEQFIAGREVIVSYVEIPPNTTMERHWHPGEEFQYYLEGTAELVIDGERTVKAAPGTVAHVPYKKMHTVVTKDEGLKVVVFRVHTRGEPVRYLEKGGSAGK